MHIRADRGLYYDPKRPRTPRKYLDFVVSGQSLGNLLKVSDSDKIGVLGWTENIDAEVYQIDEFLGLEKPELETGRTAFYVCPECGDIACGGTTAKIVHADTAVIWSDFGYERSFADTQADLSSYAHVGPYLFDRERHEQLFKILKTKKYNHEPV